VKMTDPQFSPSKDQLVFGRAGFPWPGGILGTGHQSQFLLLFLRFGLSLCGQNTTRYLCPPPLSLCRDSRFFFQAFSCKREGGGNRAPLFFPSSPVSEIRDVRVTCLEKSTTKMNDRTRCFLSAPIMGPQHTTRFDTRKKVQPSQCCPSSLYSTSMKYVLPILKAKEGREFLYWHCW
jgi:hypothetical protein